MYDIRRTRTYRIVDYRKNKISSYILYIYTCVRMYICVASSRDTRYTCVSRSTLLLHTSSSSSKLNRLVTRDMFMNHVHTSVSVDRAIRGSIANDPQNLAVFTDHTRLPHGSLSWSAIRIDPRSASIRVDSGPVDRSKTRSIVRHL
jgi:hypothetical protein